MSKPGSDHESSASPREDSPETSPPSAPETQSWPQVAVKRFRISPIWIVPIVAAGLVGYLAYLAIAHRGPMIVVTFETANGLREEQTVVKHKAVSLGTVQAIELSDGADHVVVQIRMNERAEPMLTKGARFWVVRPRLSNGPLAALQTGFETLISGAYIELDPGRSGGPRQTAFKGLEKPPAVRSGEPGTVFMLHTSELGAIGQGTPILYQHVTVGEVLDFAIDDETGSVAVRAFVRAPHDALIHDGTCFWNASGLSVESGARGLTLRLESLRTVLSGGIAFRTPAGAASGPPAKAGDTFLIYDSEASAESHLYGESIPFFAYFRDSADGLATGSVVQMFGMPVGSVTDLRLVPTASEDPPGLSLRVGFVVQPQRVLAGAAEQALSERGMREQIERGLRVVLETRSLVTGEKALSLSYGEAGSSAALRQEDGRLVIPSQVRGLDAVTNAVSDVATRLSQIPYEEIGASLQRSLRSVEGTLSGPEMKRALVALDKTLTETQGLAHDARAGLGPALERMPRIAAELEQAVGRANDTLAQIGRDDGELWRSTQHLVRQASEMARNVRQLADYLQQHPEDLIRGRKERESR